MNMRSLACIVVVAGIWIGCHDPQPAAGETTMDASSEVEATDGWVRTSTWPSGQVRREVLLDARDSVEVRMFHENGVLDRVARYEAGQKTGVWQAFYPDGTKWAEHQYEAGVQIGPYTTWHPNGQVAIEGHYNAEGQPTGTWLFFDSLGNVQREVAGKSLPLR